MKKRINLTLKRNDITYNYFYVDKNDKPVLCYDITNVYFKLDMVKKITVVLSDRKMKDSYKVTRAGLGSVDIEIEECKNESRPLLVHSISYLNELNSKIFWVGIEI